MLRNGQPDIAQETLLLKEIHLAANYFEDFLTVYPRTSTFTHIKE